jgi:hypothetical protein
MSDQIDDIINNIPATLSIPKGDEIKVEGGKVVNNGSRITFVPEQEGHSVVLSIQKKGKVGFLVNNK